MVPALRYYLDGKRQLDFENHKGWDVFISAFNDSERVQRVFEHVTASIKQWWILPEYGYAELEFPRNGAACVALPHTNEADLVMDGLSSLGAVIAPGVRLCVDITGLMRPHILFLMKYLCEIGIKNYDMIYTEPEHYSRKAETAFSLDEDSIVRQVAGFEGEHQIEMSNDILILGGGYDHSLVGRVMLSKENAKVVQLHGFPSLSADMYHESLLRLDRVSSAGEISQDNVFFSSANDPYVTAATLSEAVAVISARKPITNLYLSTLSTKVQAVGFGLFYLTEMRRQPASIIFPFFKRYSRETSKGWGRTWVYPIAL